MLAIPVIQLLKDKEHRLNLELLTGDDGVDKKIVIPRIQKPGLALTGDPVHLHTGRIQVFGKPEISYLESLNSKLRKEIITKMCKPELSCIVLTCGLTPPSPMIEACQESKIPLFSTKLLTFTFINRINRFLEDHLTAATCVHGVLVDVFGIGILIIGRSGIGKSELALDLILRGHRLIADDIINIKKKPPSTLYGASSEIIKYHMEIRGLGIINIKDLFGIAAIRDKKLIELVIELEEWNPGSNYDRLGIDENHYTLLGVHIPFIKIPVRPGRNIAAIVEIAARNQLLKLGGHYSAREFQEQLNEEIMSQTEPQESIWEQLE